MHFTVSLYYPSSGGGWTATATIVIAAIVALIAGFQWHTSNEKLRLDLYDRRFDIYARVLNFLARMNDQGADRIAPREILIQEYVRGEREAKFLFADDPSIAALIEKIRKNAIIVSDFNLIIIPHANDFGARLSSEIEKHKNAQQAVDHDLPLLEDKLKPFLEFGDGRKWRLPRSRRNDDAL